MTRSRDRWFVAELVERIRVAGDPRVVVHVNYQLVSARNASAAYAAAIELGKSNEITYANPRGKRVTIRFIGLRDLHRVHDALEHGAELMYEEHVHDSDKASREMVKPRGRLAVFRSERPRRKTPDYSAGDIVRAAKRMLRTPTRKR